MFLGKNVVFCAVEKGLRDILKGLWDGFKLLGRTCRKVCADLMLNHRPNFLWSRC